MGKNAKRILPKTFRAPMTILKEYKADQYRTAVMSAVKEKFADALAGLNDPAQRFQRFIEAINDGMPDAEAAHFFLCMNAETYAQFLEDNEEAAGMVHKFKGQVARDQYKKVTRSDDPRIALRWLEQNRAEDWGPKQKVALSNDGDEPLLIKVVYADSNPNPADAPRVSGADQAGSETV